MHNFFLDRVRTDEPNGYYIFPLSDTVATVYRLIFHRRIPPRVDKINVVRFGEVETHSTCYQADQKYTDILICLEILHLCSSIFRLPSQVDKRNIFSFELSFNQVQHPHKLRKN